MSHSLYIFLGYLSILAFAAQNGVVSTALTPFPTDVCGMQAWPYNGPGLPLTAQLPDEELASILDEIDPSRIEAIIQKLVSFGTRSTLSSQTDPNRGIGAARDWLLSQYQDFAKASNGRMKVELQSYIQPIARSIPAATNISNIVAVLAGSKDASRIYVVSGHYDSRNTNVTDGIGDAPGADDDGSGVAISMELARIMATRDPAATIIFAAVAGEEQGLYGSGYLAQTLANSSANVEGMFTNDIVGSPIGDDGRNSSNIVRLFAQGIPSNESEAKTATRIQIGGENDSPARELGRFTRDVASNSFTGMSVELEYRADRYLRGGDHESFLAAGYPAARFTEARENFAHQHQNVRYENGTQYGDLIEYCDFYYISRVGKVTAAAIWSLANAPGMPSNVTIDTSILTNNSTLNWNKTDGAASYEIVWRPTIWPSWTHVIQLGNVLTATVDLSKDNVIFGVRSVSPAGYKSPAVLPFPVS